MSRPLLRAVPFAALALTACVENNADSGFTILRNLAPAEGCVVDPQATEFRSSGQIEVAAVRGYYLTPVARNDLAVAGSATETQQTVFVEGAQIEIEFYDRDFFTAEEQTQFRTDGLTRFTVPTSGSIDPDGGVATFGFEVVPPALLRAIDAKLPDFVPGAAAPSTLLDVRVQLVGIRAGSSIESNRFRYPVEVCDGCLSDDAGACDALPSDFSGGEGGACNLEQDAVLSCCTEGTVTICPARSSGTKT